MTPQLPHDLHAFLSEGRQLQYDHVQCECGLVVLRAVGSHTLDHLPVDGQSLNDVATDPNSDTLGYYAVPAISLTATSDDYAPAHILSWLPDSGVYGTYDCDHEAFTIFPGKTWQDIVKDPLTYLNAQWLPTPEAEPLVPWTQYRFFAR